MNPGGAEDCAVGVCHVRCRRMNHASAWDLGDDFGSCYEPTCFDLGVSRVRFV